MNQKNRLRFCTVLLVATSIQQAFAGDILGTVIDTELNEPLYGAVIKVMNSQTGAVADLDGNFSIRNLKKGEYTLEISYLSFLTQHIQIQVPAKGAVNVKVEMKADNKSLDEVTVTARKNFELERILLAERKQSNIAIENLGAGEMSVKGISNVQEGVKRISGISIADAGQLVVRGLGDRYSITTLNGMPIASPNPDNKLIPLDLFPSSTVQNITVSKVYSPSTFADYSGAHVNISTKENKTDGFFSLSLNTGGTWGSTFSDFYQMDRKGTLFTSSKIDQKALDLPLQDYDQYAQTHDIFPTSFQTRKRTTLPNIGGNVGWGKTFNLNHGDLDLIASLGVSSDYKNVYDAYNKSYDATGVLKSEYTYDKFTQENRLSGLFNTNYKFRRFDFIRGTFFYARNASDNYMSRNVLDEEKHRLLSSNQTTHIYNLQDYQLAGHHEFGDHWKADWSGSYNISKSDEPDRRQVMYEIQDDESLKLFTLNQQEIMRYYGELNEDEWVGDLKVAYHLNKNDKLRIGAAIKDKKRDFMGVDFFYNVDKINELYAPFDNIYDTDGYLNFDQVQQGNITINRRKVPSNSYQAGNRIIAGFLDADFLLWNKLSLNAGVRFENSRQWVEYYEDGDNKAKIRNLDCNDFFPALNLKYDINKAHAIRLSASRTVTRPQFVEMAPFKYQESYGSANLRGNADLTNGYNYNFDLRYEWFRPNSNDMIAITGYYKYLETPIERTQWVSGGAREYSFQNATDGLAAGIEVEIRKEIIKDLSTSVNASYMYTNVQLPSGMVYTNTERQLQGASPYIVNADLSYTPSFSKDRKLSMALLYNLQGKRIQAVGIQKQGDVYQETLHTLNLNLGYQFNKHLSAKLQVKNLLNSDFVLSQELPIANKTVEVERYENGIDLDLSISYKF